ncbi:MAG: asparagine synthetase B, partial [Halobacteriovoraceae bacterium]|nr:asparagine synthetase B [Halobacteriovoraceae bacterium]
MCGIVAIVSKSNKDHARLGKALEVLNHRGPDDQGSYSEEDVISLGHKRLSIIDLSIEAKQ